MALTELELQRKREHKNVLRANNSPKQACYKDPEPETQPCPAPPSVTKASKSNPGFFGFLAKQASRIWNRKV